MDLRQFHPSDDPLRYKRMDRANSHTGKWTCYFYEWIGWYNMSVSLRLLGHYRLFQLYKAQKLSLEAGMPLNRGYILQCRNTNGFKYFLNRCFTLLNSIVMRGNTDPSTVVHGVNRILLYDRPDILEHFLLDAGEDFDQAYRNAMRQINDPSFLVPAIAGNNSATFIQVNNDQRQNILNHNESHVHTVIHELTPGSKGATGKTADVFSKKQILILFDLLTRSGNLEHIDLKNPGRTEALAKLLAAITGKPTTTWMEEIKNYKTSDLYDCPKPGQRSQLVSTMENLAGKFRSAGFRTIAKEADIKMRELERHR